MHRSIGQRRWHALGLALVALCWLWLPARTATAHPMGNFSINLYSRLTVGANNVDVAYVVDMAEIPTYQEWGSTPPTEQTQQTYLAQQADALRTGLQLVVDGRAHDLAIVNQAISFPEGQGGLRTTRIELQLTTALPPLAPRAQRSLRYHDTNYAERLGWHEIVVQRGAGASIVQSDAPATDLSDALRTYPQDMLSSPPDLRSTDLLIEAGTGAGTPAEAPQTSAARRSPPDRFAALIVAPQLTPRMVLLALLAALGLGAVHALSPGHGKTVVAAYLVGARGTARHAFFLGLTVTATHTLGVFVLGLVTLSASRYILPEQLYPWLGVLSGGLVVVLGLALLRQRMRALRTGSAAHHGHQHSLDHTHQHTHDRGLHRHEHMHDHGLGRHAHVPVESGGRPVSWRSLLALGVSGGLVPCPSALVVMLSAIALGRTGFGLLLIVTFSLGLASALIGIGVVFVYGSGWLSHVKPERVPQRMKRGLRLVPVISAFIVTVAGLLITAQAVVQAGWLG